MVVGGGCGAVLCVSCRLVMSLGVVVAVSSRRRRWVVVVSVGRQGTPGQLKKCLTVVVVVG